MRSSAEKRGARNGHAPFEEFASGAGFRIQAPTALGENLEAAEIFSRADAGDQQASAFIAERIDEVYRAGRCYDTDWLAHIAADLVRLKDGLVPGAATRI